MASQFQPVAESENGNDADLLALRRIADGDRAVFDGFYLRYHRRLARFLSRFTDQYAVVEEVINDTMFIVWNKAGSFRGSSKVSTWIMSIAYRQATRSLRAIHRARKRDQAAAESELVNREAVPLDIGHSLADSLENALAELPTEQRFAIELAYLMGYSGQEIAEIAQCPLSTVKSRLYTARQHLQGSLSGHNE